MDLIYLDYNCFQRGFDDPEQPRIQMESLACREIFVKAGKNEVRLVWSFMHEDETLLCPFPERKYEVLRLSSLCKVKIGPEKEIYNLAQSYQKNSGLSAKDSIHLACASYIQAGYFLTCDDDLIKRSHLSKSSLKLAIKRLNPVDYSRRKVVK